MSKDEDQHNPRKKDGGSKTSITINSLNAKVTFLRGGEALRHAGLLSDQDYRIAEPVQDLDVPLPDPSDEHLLQCHKRMVQFHRKLQDLYPDGSRILTSLVSCHGKLTTVLRKGGLSGREGLGALATTGEDISMLLSQINSPTAQRASREIIGVAADFCDKAVFMDQHASYKGLAGPISIHSRQTYCASVRDLWRDGKIRSGDPRLRLTDQDLENHPLHDLKSGDLVEQAALRVRGVMGGLRDRPGTEACGTREIEADIDDFREVGSKLRGVKSLNEASKARLHAGLMRSIGSMTERIALNLCRGQSDSPQARDFFALASTSNRRAGRYLMLARQAEPVRREQEARH